MIAAVERRKREQEQSVKAQLRREYQAARRNDAPGAERVLLRLENSAAGRAMIDAAPPGSAH